jgi:hypothetical protein
MGWRCCLAIRKIKAFDREKVEDEDGHDSDIEAVTPELFLFKSLSSFELTA